MLRIKMITSLEATYYTGRRFLGMDKLQGVYFVVPEADWVLDRVGKYITRELTNQFHVEADLTGDPHKIVGQIIHYGSLWEFLGHLGGRQNTRNTLVATVFHGDRDDHNPLFQEPFNRFLDNQHLLTKIVVSNTIMLSRMQEWGVPVEKLAFIPLGVDLQIFHPATETQKEEIRQELQIPPDAFCIGSFQKDGNGWGEGYEAKAIKGPDIFLKVIEKIRGKKKMHILLTAPARGYMRRGLEEMGVPYTHHILKDYTEIARYYRALDAYLVTSREEGGPEAILESMASGIPLVSTRVGLAPDVLIDGESGLLAESGDVEALSQKLMLLIEHAELREKISKHALVKARAYDWKKIAAQYYHEVYQPIFQRDKL